MPAADERQSPQAGKRPRLINHHSRAWRRNFPFRAYRYAVGFPGLAGMKLTTTRNNEKKLQALPNLLRMTPNLPTAMQAVTFGLLMVSGRANETEFMHVIFSGLLEA